MRDKETITIPLNKVSYEDLQALTIEQQTQLFVKDKEMERLKQINEEHQRINGELRVENDRLNNIIEEIREYTKHKIVECYDEGSTIGEFYKICDIDSKIEELLQGSDKE